ncbi:hypothetical protein D039_4981B, partial [Vibrio parahaemolyticus EKP-028]
GLTCAHCF